MTHSPRACCPNMEPAFISCLIWHNSIHVNGFREISEVDRLHWRMVPTDYDSIALKMRKAAIAAPKPLSILTTVTPAAQEFSMARSAAKPFRLAP